MNKPSNSLLFTTRIHNKLDGKEPIPDTQYIGNDCKRNHGKNGLTIRHVKGGSCIQCRVLFNRERNLSNTIKKDPIRTNINAIDNIAFEKSIEDEIKEVWDE